MLPELLDMGVTPPRMRLTAEQERRQIFRAFAQFLTQSAGPAGALLILDDLQLVAEAQNCHASANAPRKALPSDLVEIVRRQLAYLPASSQEVMRAIARAGAGAIGRAELLATVHQSEAVVQSALDQLVRIGMLREAETDVFRVNHQVVRIVAANASLT